MAQPEKKFRIHYSEGSIGQSIECDHGGKVIKLSIQNGTAAHSSSKDVICTTFPDIPADRRKPSMQSVVKPDTKPKKKTAINLQPELTCFSQGSTKKLPLPKAARVVSGAPGPTQEYFEHDGCQVRFDMQDYCEDCLSLYRQVA